MTSSTNLSNPTPRSDVQDCLFLLLGLIEAHDWVRFEEVSLANPKRFRIISKAISECKCFNEMTLLHACVRFGAPLAILDKMIEGYPHALQAKDCLG
ncbi:hypothetical protein ACHAWF_011646 [Thalassiosira exigua]